MDFKIKSREPIDRHIHKLLSKDVNPVLYFEIHSLSRSGFLGLYIATDFGLRSKLYWKLTS